MVAAGDPGDIGAMLAALPTSIRGDFDAVLDCGCVTLLGIGAYRRERWWDEH
jgi:hypothetical protein